jgi:hypothetical protein
MVPRRVSRVFGAVLLLVSAAAGGPGLTALEIWSHLEAGASPHGAWPHFETQEGQDHGDRCEIGLLSSPARASIGGCLVLRTGAEALVSVPTSDPSPRAQAPALLPPSRAPPAPALAS